MSKFFLGGEDISAFVSNVDLGRDDAEATRKIAGLQDGSLTLHLDNSDGTFTADMTKALFPPPTVRVTYRYPDGRWQRIKYWLKTHGMRWLKVRYVAYTFDAKLTGRGEGASFQAVSPVGKGTEER